MAATEPEEIFRDEFENHCSKAIELYQSRFQPCAFEFSDRSKCVSVSIVHADHHQNWKGLRYTGKMDFSDYVEDRSATVQSIKQTFISLYKDLHSSMASESTLTKSRLARVIGLRREILGSNRLSRTETLTYLDSTPKSFWARAKSTATCFACLQSVPDHTLPCGHALCDDCVKDFGSPLPLRHYCYTLDECILCHGRFDKPQVVKLIPRCSGIRVLTLDGGGVRGVLELAVLKKVEERIGLGLPIRDFFDLIVGTSTGELLLILWLKRKHD